MDNYENTLSRERICACALNSIFGYEPMVGRALMQHFGSAADVFSVSEKQIDSVLGPFSKYRGKICRRARDEAESQLEGLRQTGYRFVCISEPDYPAALLECEDPPLGLYVRSESTPAEIFSPRPAIAIVGTRDISPYGREWTRKIVEALAQAPAKPVIVSGLAFGVDICAHRAALDCGLSTIAVLPAGIQQVYPHSHTAEAARIASAPGSALITDYPPGTSPVAFTFLRRNRIIAALSLTTILVESKIHGGGLITARLAAGYSREVLCLPGRIDDVRSQGCNLLLREKTAEPITDLAFLGEQAGLGSYSLRRRKDLCELLTRKYSGNPDCEALVEMAAHIRKARGSDLDDLCHLSGLPYPRVASLVGRLESDGIVSTDLAQRCTINAKIV